MEPDAKHFRERSITLDVNDRARFFGYQVDVSGYMQGADCLVSPTPSVPKPSTL